MYLRSRFVINLHCFGFPQGGDDCRQEVLAMQLIQLFHHVWGQADLSLRLRPYAVLATSFDSGLLETVTNTCSIDGLKKSLPGVSLAQFFECYFGPRQSERFHEAQRTFANSMAAYSLVCYFLQVRFTNLRNYAISYP